VEPFVTKRPFILFPAIDLKGGQVVRLAEGDMARTTVFSGDPAGQARLFGEAGAPWLHIVDLNGAFEGYAVNQLAIEGIVKAFPGQTQVGGGVRDAVAIARWLNLGVSRVVLGTAALKNPELVKTAARFHPGRIVVAVDARDGRVAVEGWAKVSELTAIDMGKRFEDAGVAALLYTDVSRDGLLSCVNIEATVALAEAVSIPVIASGGVADLAGVLAVAEAARASTGHIEGVISGRAIYDGRLDLAQALAALAG
jgi:phosphoribosylformimino-5-aminoimidazole carboxamide ribotide isomerase